MRHRIAKVLRRVAQKLDPQTPTALLYEPVVTTTSNVKVNYEGFYWR